VNHCPFSLELFFLPVSITLTFLFSLGIAFFIATLAVFFSDIADIYSVALSILNYLIPIFYPISIVPKKYVAFIHWNPLFYFLEIFRQPIHQVVLPNGGLVLRACLIAIGVFLAGWWFFTKKCDEFSYRV
jgi:lipopolysaccharide transport system permease protein